MTATLDTVASLLEALISEVKLSRLVWEAHQCGVVAPPNDTEDPKVMFVPKSWRGQDFKGATYSECSPEFLDQLASALTNIASNEKAERKLYKNRPAYVYSLQKAGRARRWALRMRMGWTPPPKAAATPLPGGIGATGGLSGSGGLASAVRGRLGETVTESQDEDDSFEFGANAPTAGSESTRRELDELEEYDEDLSLA